MPTHVHHGLAFAAFALIGCFWQPTSLLAADEGTRASRLPLAPPGTRFYFDVIQSHDERYAGDTPSHLGRDGGLVSRPNVALGDAVHRREGDHDTLVGHVTSASWDRVSGSLTVEFNPVEKVRVAVGDEVWVELNPKAP